jgi:hypothetical protein
VVFWLMQAHAVVAVHVCDEVPDQGRVRYASLACDRSRHRAVDNSSAALEIPVDRRERRVAAAAPNDAVDARERLDSSTVRFGQSHDPIPFAQPAIVHDEITGLADRRENRRNWDEPGIRLDETGRALPQPRLERAQARRRPYPVPDGAQERASIPKAGQVTQEAMTPVAKRDGPCEQPAQGRVTFHESEMPIAGPTKEMCSMSKPASQVGTPEIACPKVMDAAYRDVPDCKQLRSIFGRSGREPGVENEKVSGGEVEELLPLAWRRIAIRHGREVRIDMRSSRGQPGGQHGRE